MKRFWILNFTVAIPLGMIQAWASVLDLNLEPFGISTLQSAWLGCLMTIAGGAASIIVAVFMDKFIGRLKTVACTCLAAGAGFMFFFVLELKKGQDGDDAPDTNRMYAFCIGSGFFINTAIPLFFELIVEGAYGVISEAVAMSVQTMSNTLVQICILSLPSRVNGSTIWMDWLTLSAYIFGFVAMLFFRVEYERMQLDAKNPDSTEVANGCDAIGLY